VAEEEPLLLVCADGRQSAARVCGKQATSRSVVARGVVSCTAVYGRVLACTGVSSCRVLPCRITVHLDSPLCRDVAGPRTPECVHARRHGSADQRSRCDGVQPHSRCLACCQQLHPPRHRQAGFHECCH
jgi:hypothetical protein